MKNILLILILLLGLNVSAQNGILKFKSFHLTFIEDEVEETYYVYDYVVLNMNENTIKIYDSSYTIKSGFHISDINIQEYENGETGYFFDVLSPTREHLLIMLTLGDVISQFVISDDDGDMAIYLLNYE